MSYELIGESIKSAISIKLGEIFRTPVTQNGQQVTQNGQPVYTYPIRYKESITNMQYPSFHIIQVNTNITPLQTKVEGAFNKDLKRIQLDYLFNIQYRVAKDTELVSNLRQQLDGIGFILLTEFTEIDLERPVYTKNCRYEIVDGVLQFFCNITVYATNSQVNEEEMSDLSIEEQINELVIPDQTEETNNEEEE